MSVYTTLRTHFVSSVHLRAALLDMGFPEVELHEQPQALEGYLGFERRQLAEVIIRRQFIGEASNDIGFARDSEGRLQALISDYDRHQYDLPWLQQLGQRYAYHVARTELGARGFDLVQEAREEDGTIRLVARRRAHA